MSETGTQSTLDTAAPMAGGNGMGTHYRDKLLSIKTPVTVILAEKKETLRDVMALVPGAMLTFETHCDHPLELSVGGHTIANGETVKIGDKFGIRIREVGVEPPE